MDPSATREPISGMPAVAAAPASGVMRNVAAPGSFKAGAFSRGWVGAPT